MWFYELVQEMNEQFDNSQTRREHNNLQFRSIGATVELQWADEYSELVPQLRMNVDGIHFTTTNGCGIACPKAITSGNNLNLIVCCYFPAVWYVSVFHCFFF